MAKSKVNTRLNESEASFYVESVCEHADALFRFAYALTLDLNTAFDLVKATMQDVVARLHEVYGGESADIKKTLFKIAYAKAAKISSTKRSGGEGLAGALGKLSLAERALVVAYDVMGLSFAETSEALAMDNQNELRLTLANARKALLESRAFA